MRDVTTIYDALHWYHLYNLKNVKNNHGGVLLLVLKITPPWVFSYVFRIVQMVPN